MLKNNQFPNMRQRLRQPKANIRTNERKRKFMLVFFTANE